MWIVWKMSSDDGVADNGPVGGMNAQYDLGKAYVALGLMAVVGVVVLVVQIMGYLLVIALGSVCLFQTSRTDKIIGVAAIGSVLAPILLVLVGVMIASLI